MSFFSDEGVEKSWIKHSIQTMREKINSLRVLDDQIVEFIGSLESEGVETLIEKEDDKMREN